MLFNVADKGIGICGLLVNAVRSDVLIVGSEIVFIKTNLQNDD